MWRSLVLMVVCAGIGWLSPTTVRANPYAISGGIAPARLAQLGFPEDTETYAWGQLTEDAQHPMPQPMDTWYNYFNPASTYMDDWTRWDARNQPREWFTQENYPTDAPWKMRRGLNLLLTVALGCYHVDRRVDPPVMQIGLPAEILPQWYLDEGGNQQQRLTAWISSHLGRTWIIGNEPNHADQDNLSPEQYARMYHDYRTFITEHDPTARVAVGACAMDVYLPSVESARNWWTQMITAYKAQTGQATMPVDIWNFHLYAPPWITAPTQVMDIGVRPFTQFVRTIEEGIYANCPLWCTEFGIGAWAGASNLHWSRIYMNNICLTWERESEIDRWFWFLGPYEEQWEYTCLLNRDQQTLSQLGQHYRTLAQGYPNDASSMMDLPRLQPAPPVFADDFQAGLRPEWIIKAGNWIAEASACRQVGFPAWNGHSLTLPYDYASCRFAVDIHINAAASPENWAGVTLRKSNMFHNPTQSGYLVYLRANGELGLLRSGAGTIASCTSILSSATDGWHHLEIELINNSFRISLDQQLAIQHRDADSPFMSGWAALEVNKTDTTFDNVVIEEIITPAIQGNPYAIGGYIPRVELARLGFPPGVETYGWGQLAEDSPYPFPRPLYTWYNYFNPTSTYMDDWARWEAKLQPREWFTQENYPTDAPWKVRQGLNVLLTTACGCYHVDRRVNPPVMQIGLPAEILPQWYLDEGGNQQERLAAWVRSHPGRTWVLGNEPGAVPDLTGHGQDALTDRQYVTFFHDYYEFVSSLDPTARFANAALAMTTTPSWRADLTVDSVTAIWENVLALYHATHGVEMPIDVWNMHLYSGAPCQQKDLFHQKFLDAIMAFRQFVDTTRGGRYRGLPLIMTEFNGNYAQLGQLPTQELHAAFLRNFAPYLDDLKACHVLDKCFWFISVDEGNGEWAGNEIVDKGQLTLVGESWRSAAWHWETDRPIACTPITILTLIATPTPSDTPPPSP